MPQETASVKEPDSAIPAGKYTHVPSRLCHQAMLSAGLGSGQSLAAVRAVCRGAPVLQVGPHVTLEGLLQAERPAAL